MGYEVDRQFDVSALLLRLRCWEVTRVSQRPSQNIYALGLPSSTLTKVRPIGFRLLPRVGSARVHPHLLQFWSDSDHRPLEQEHANLERVELAVSEVCAASKECVARALVSVLRAMYTTTRSAMGSAKRNPASPLPVLAAEGGEHWSNC